MNEIKRKNIMSIAENAERRPKRRRRWEQEFPNISKGYEINNAKSRGNSESMDKSAS